MSVVINYCTNEYCFIDATLRQCLKFSDDIVVSYGTHMYDGTPEPISHYELLKAKYPEVQFVQYTVDTTVPSSELRGVGSRRNAYWCNLARWTGFQSLKRKGWVFFIDVDEVPEGDRVKEFLQYLNPDPSIAYKLSNYWYFKAPTHQAIPYEDSIVLVHASHVCEDTVFGDDERDRLTSAPSKLRTNVMGMNGRPLFHHFSWVRSKEHLMKKLTSWSHNMDFPNPERVVAEVFSTADVNDIIHRYTYRTVPNYFEIDPELPVPMEFPDSDAPNVHA